LTLESLQKRVATLEAVICGLVVEIQAVKDQQEADHEEHMRRHDEDKALILQLHELLDQRNDSDNWWKVCVTRKGRGRDYLPPSSACTGWGCSLR